MDEQTQNEQLPTEQSPETLPAGKLRLTWKFAVGFLGWYLVMVLVYLVLLQDVDEFSLLICGGITFLGQIAVLGLLTVIKESRLVALGILAAFAVNLVVSLFLGMALNAMCFVPFFVPLE